jgi:uncharacterized protein
MHQTPSSSGSQNQANLWAMLCHLSALAGFLVPFGSLIGPILVWQIKKKEFPFVDDQGKEAVNFQLSVFLYVLVSMVLMFIGIGFILVAAVGIGALVLSVIAAIKANQGIAYRYPLKIHWIK